jgi:hypothetical protein
MEERRTIHRWQDVADPTEWTCEDEHGHEWFRRRGGESPQEMEEAGYLEVPMGTFADEIWMAEEHAGCGGPTGVCHHIRVRADHGIKEIRAQPCLTP